MGANPLDRVASWHLAQTGQCDQIQPMVRQSGAVAVVIILRGQIFVNYPVDERYSRCIMRRVCRPVSTQRI